MIIIAFFIIFNVCCAVKFVVDSQKLIRCSSCWELINE